jgi:hypothetical protein
MGTKVMPVLPRATFEPWNGNGYTGNSDRALKTILFLCRLYSFPVTAVKITTNSVA